MKRALALVLLGMPALVVPPASVGAPPPDRTWMERVERDRDRAEGRVVESPEWETRRMYDSRSPQFGEPRVRREFDRLDEERERRMLLDARARRGERSLLEPDAGSVILGRPPGAAGVVMSPAAAQAAADEQTLGAARERLDRSVRGVNVAEQRSLRGLRRRLTREGRAGEYEQEAAPVRARYEQLRAGHRGDYQRTRSRVLGRPD